jgi:hypothetical protein
MDENPFFNVKPTKNVVIKKIIPNKPYNRLRYNIKKYPDRTYFCCGRTIKGTSMQAHLMSQKHIFNTIIKI